MAQVLWLSDLQPLHTSSMGHSIGWLAQLCHHQCPVRPAWVIPSAKFEDIWGSVLAQHRDRLPKSTPSAPPLEFVHNTQQLQQTAQVLQRDLLQVPCPEHIREEIAAALKSAVIHQCRLKLSVGSAVHQDTSLPVDWWDVQWVAADVQSIWQGVLRLWANCFSAHHLVYWYTQGYDWEQIRLDVLVQDMGQVSRAGFLHLDPDGYQIEAVWGLNLAIMRGEVIPTRCTYDRTGHLVNHRLGHQTVVYGSEANLPQQDLVTTPPTPQPPDAFLSPYWLSPTLQQQTPLSDGLLSHLQGLAGQIWAAFPTPSMVEWVYDPWDSGCVWIVGGHHRSSPSKLVQDARMSLAELPAATSGQQRFVGLAAAPGQVSAMAWIVPNTEQLPSEVPSDVVLVARELHPDWLSVLQQVKGVVLERSGLTSHAAIVARELGIPAVINLPNVLDHLDSGMMIQLDGDRGEIRIVDSEASSPAPLPRTTPSQLAALDARVSPDQRSQDAPNPVSSSAVRSLPIPQVINGEQPTRTQLMVTLSQPESVKQLQNCAVRGVGLLRSEFMLLNLLEGKHPVVWSAANQLDRLGQGLFAQIEPILQAVAPHPVFYRFLDLKLHELRSLQGGNQASVTARFGDRGISNTPLFTDLLKMQLSLLQKLHHQGYENLHVLIPFVRRVEDFEFYHQQMVQAGLLQSGTMQVWMMAEVPSVLFLLPEYQRAGVQGISIGTNDLTQLLLGIDRDQPPQPGLNECHPAVQRAIAQLIAQSRHLQLPCSICGDAPVLYPNLIDALVEWGITSISVHPRAFASTLNRIVQVEQRLFRFPAPNTANPVS